MKTSCMVKYSMKNCLKLILVTISKVSKNNDFNFNVLWYTENVKKESEFIRSLSWGNNNKFLRQILLALTESP